MRSLNWIDAEMTGWACSNCEWICPAPTLLGAAEAKQAYDRLAAAKFREHKCEAELGSSTTKSQTADADSAFVARAHTLIKLGYKPKVAVDLVLHEMESFHSGDRTIMDKARADARAFLLKLSKGLI